MDNRVLLLYMVLPQCTVLTQREDIDRSMILTIVIGGVDGGVVILLLKKRHI